jgi:hypothetical protein
MNILPNKDREKEKGDRKFFIVTVLIVLTIIGGLILYSNRRFFSNPSLYLSTVDQAWKIRYQRAEKPLQIFNDSIFKWIEFRGIIMEKEYDRFSNENNESIEVYYFIASLDRNIYNPQNVPLEVKRIYDVRNPEKAKIYWLPQDCTFDDESKGDSIIKNYGEDFYRIKFKTDKPNYPTPGRCDKLYYTTDFDYFWTVKNIGPFIDSLLYEARTK